MDPIDLRTALGAFFPENVVQCRPGATFNRDGQDQAAVLWYIDARDVMNRLDDVLGPGGWQTQFELFLDKNMVMCHLSCKVGGEWITKTDVGALSEQPDEGDKYKAAFSDSLKRSAVHWGVGRYLYEMPFQSHAFDKQRKRFSGNPKLPAAFAPKAPGVRQAAQAPRPQQPAPEPQHAPPQADQAAVSAKHRERLEKLYGEVNTREELTHVNQQVAADRDLRASLTPDDRNALLAAAEAAKKRCEENDLIANTPFGG